MLTLTHVTKTFNKGTVNEKPALTGVDLHLEPGDFVLSASLRTSARFAL